MRGLSPEDAASVIAIERACSAISLMGCMFVLVTFTISDAFRQRMATLFPGDPLPEIFTPPARIAASTARLPIVLR